MRLLLDTCALLWFVDDANQLSARAAKLLDDESNEVFVSVASYWEIVLKYSRGRLELPCPPDEWFRAAVHPDAVLSIQASDIDGVYRLGAPTGHADPFDRLLVATAQCLELTVVTSDPAFRSYAVSVEW